MCVSVLMNLVVVEEFLFAAGKSVLFIFFLSLSRTRLLTSVNQLFPRFGSGCGVGGRGVAADDASGCCSSRYEMQQCCWRVPWCELCSAGTNNPLVIFVARVRKTRTVTKELCRLVLPAL